MKINKDFILREIAGDFPAENGILLLVSRIPDNQNDQKLNQQFLPGLQLPPVIDESKAAQYNSRPEKPPDRKPDKTYATSFIKHSCFKINFPINVSVFSRFVKSVFHFLTLTFPTSEPAPEWRNRFPDYTCLSFATADNPDTRPAAAWLFAAPP